MTLLMLEAKWKAALVSILEELTEPQFSKLLFKLDRIPQGLKSSKAREDIPNIIIQYYGTEESISVIDKEMKLIPRNDAAVQHLLLPFVEKLKKKQKVKGRKSNATPDSGAVAKKPKPEADQLKSCRPDEMLPVRAVKPQQTVTQESSMQPTGSMETKMLLVGAVKTQQAVTQESSMQPTGSMETKMLPVGAVKPQQTVTQESSMQQTGFMETKMLPVGAVKTQQTVKQASSMQRTGFMETKMLPVGAVKTQQTVKQASSMQRTGFMETKMLPVGAVKTQQTVKQASSMQRTGSMETKMLPVGAVKTQQTVKQASSMQRTGSMETKMTLMMLEMKWKSALVSILEELTEPQFSMLLFKLDSIPQVLKYGRTREDIPNIIVQYYGTEESISVIDKEMKLLPRNDAAVQQLLLPFVEKLKKKQKVKGRKSNATPDSGAVAKKPKPEADQLKSCRPDEMLPVRAVKPQQTVTQESSMQPTGSMETKMLLVGAVKTQQAVTQESSMQPTGSMETKVQSAAVQTGRITVIRIKKSNKFYTHLLIEFNDQLQTVFVTTRLLANAFGYIVNDDFMERFSYEIPLTAEAKIQGNKIIEIKNR